MNYYLIANQSIIRLLCFMTILVIIAIWEIIAPRRTLTISKVYRWINNLGLVFINNLVLKFIFPITTTAVALWAANNGLGLINYWQISGWWIIALSIIALDFIIYLQHVMFHAVPILWKLHQVHHADLDFDVTTGTRFHTLEIILSMLIKLAAIVLFGIPAVAVVMFEILLNATAMFNHSNISLPLKIDVILRYWLVTPDMHRVHHSVLPSETNSNFGFNLPWWDRLCGTYQAQPKFGHLEMTIGLSYFRDIKTTQWLKSMLVMPFNLQKYKNKLWK
jgi:sterol desaturase/sphingolipid hydroxylase (fatty acid hydroxylase superfamily)